MITSFCNKKLIEIVEEVTISDIEDIGLLSGNSGISVFLFYFSAYSGNNSYCNNAISLLEKNINKINRCNDNHTFCGGISGFLWSLNHMAINDFLNKEDISGLLNDFDEYLFNKMISDIKLGNYDFLHGAIGIGNYFLKRINENKNAETYIKKLVDEIEKQSYRENDDSYKWLTIIDYKTGLKGYNLSLSHGIASIIAFLGKLYEKKIYKEKVEELLHGSLKYLMKNILDNSKYGYYFPGYVNNRNLISGGRLSWCYYDLGTAVVLYNVGKIINDENLIDKALEILSFSSKKRGVQSSGIVDAGLCHGTSGIAHIFNRMYFNTRIEMFKDTAEYWFDETLKMAIHKDGLAGYKAYRTEEFGGWVNEYGILEGISGIGLAMLSWLTQTEPTWDECLLLS